MADGNPAGQLQEFIDVLSRRRWQILLPALFVLTIGSVFAVIVPKKAVVESRIQVYETRNPFDTNFRSRAESVTSREMENVPQHIINHQRVERFVSTEMADDWPEYQSADKARKDEIIQVILRNLSVERVVKQKEKGSTFFDLKYRDTSGKRAEAFLKRLNTAWIDDLVDEDVQGLERERKVLESEAAAKTKAAEFETERWIEQCNIVRHNPAEAPGSSDRWGTSAKNVNWELLDDYQRQQQKNEGELNVALTNLDELRGSYAQEPDSIAEVQPLAGQKFDAEIGEIDKKLEALRLDLARLRPQNKQYGALKALIDAGEERKAEYVAQATEDSEKVRDVPNPRKELLRDEVEKAARKVATLESDKTWLDAKIIEYEEVVDSSSEEHALLSAIYLAKEDAVQARQLALAELGENSKAIRLVKETSGRLYKVVSPPVASEAAKEPNPYLLGAFSLFAGLALGLAIALAAEYGRNSYRTISDLSSVMTVPVLGSIGGIVTRAEKRRANFRRTTVAVSTTVIVVGMSLIAYAYASESALLPVAVVQKIEDLRMMMM